MWYLSFDFSIEKSWFFLKSNWIERSEKKWSIEEIRTFTRSFAWKIKICIIEDFIFVIKRKLIINTYRDTFIFNIAYFLLYGYWVLCNFNYIYLLVCMIIILVATFIHWEKEKKSIHIKFCLLTLIFLSEAKKRD